MKIVFRDHKTGEVEDSWGLYTSPDGDVICAKEWEHQGYGSVQPRPDLEAVIVDEAGSVLCVLTQPAKSFVCDIDLGL